MFIGRQNELRQIEKALQDTSKAQLIILYGRRRIGKSRLIKESIRSEKKILFFEGLEGESTAVQLDQFLNDLSKQTKKVKLAAKSWREAFQGLEETILDGRWIIFIDELPWLAAEKSSLISELKLYWDRWSIQNPKLVLFLCGSVANFMVKHVVHSKALHNRKTLEICLPPLTPQESSLFIPKRGLREKALMYMCLGGVPKYLEQIDPKQSIEKNINRLCLTRHGFFVEEFETIFKEQFRSSRHYESIVKELSQGACSLSDLSKKTKLEKGGGLKLYLNNLERASFIKEYQTFSFGRTTGSKTKKYKLIDPFLTFYFHFIQPRKNIIQKNENSNLLESISQAKWNAFFGLQFERLCEDSFVLILKKLDIELHEVKNFGSYFQQRTLDHSGVQIDLVIELNDRTLHFLEFKYYDKPVGSSVAKDMEAKIQKLKLSANITIEKTLVTMNGVTKDLRDSKYFDHLLTLEDLLT